MSDSWVVQNLNNALNTWNEKLAEVWELLLMSPQSFKGGGIWKVILQINGAVQAIGLALLVLFFLVGVVKTTASLTEIKRPEHALKLFIRFCIAKGVVTYGLELMLALFTIAQGVMSTMMKASGVAKIGKATLPDKMVKAIEDCGFFESIPLWAVTLIGSLFITVLSFIIILTVYGRFFKLYMYTALSPIPLASFAGQPSQSIGIGFLKSYAAVCMEGAVIILACIIFTKFAGSPPAVDGDAAPAAMVWKYVGELVFNMLVLVGAVKMSDRISRPSLSSSGIISISSSLTRLINSSLVMLFPLFLHQSDIRSHAPDLITAMRTVFGNDSVCHLFLLVYPSPNNSLDILSLILTAPTSTSMLNTSSPTYFHTMAAGAASPSTAGGLPANFVKMMHARMMTAPSMQTAA